MNTSRVVHYTERIRKQGDRQWFRRIQKQQVHVSRTRQQTIAEIPGARHTTQSSPSPSLYSVLESEETPSSSSTSAARVDFDLGGLNESLPDRLAGVWGGPMDVLRLFGDDPLSCASSASASVPSTWNLFPAVRFFPLFAVDNEAGAGDAEGACDEDVAVVDMVTVPNAALYLRAASRNSL